MMLKFPEYKEYRGRVDETCVNRSGCSLSQHAFCSWQTTGKHHLIYTDGYSRVSTTLDMPRGERANSIQKTGK
ncbi:hypothetical protein EYF80_026866 [Liparis tanakae]|uniref:Uncharacterized protein n=1 Tax=Liparis tanakae TaxID=230148 RepID=A0A4Z2HDE8_9TELE|nr:hypothetical protein EYF80_026866 [Liparis tanakae]